MTCLALPHYLTCAAHQPACLTFPALLPRIALPYWLGYLVTSLTACLLLPASLHHPLCLPSFSTSLFCPTGFTARLPCNASLHALRFLPDLPSLSARLPCWMRLPFTALTTTLACPNASLSSPTGWSFLLPPLHCLSCPMFGTASPIPPASPHQLISMPLFPCPLPVFLPFLPPMPPIPAWMPRFPCWLPALPWLSAAFTAPLPGYLSPTTLLCLPCPGSIQACLSLLLWLPEYRAMSACFLTLPASLTAACYPTCLPTCLPCTPCLTVTTCPTWLCQLHMLPWLPTSLPCDPSSKPYPACLAMPHYLPPKV